MYKKQNKNNKTESKKKKLVLCGEKLSSFHYRKDFLLKMCFDINTIVFLNMKEVFFIVAPK